MPIFTHTFEKVFGWDEVALLPLLAEESGLEAGEVLLEGGIALSFLEHEPYHY